MTTLRAWMMAALLALSGAMPHALGSRCGECCEPAPADAAEPVPGCCSHDLQEEEAPAEGEPRRPVDCNCMLDCCRMAVPVFVPAAVAAAPPDGAPVAGRVLSPSGIGGVDFFDEIPHPPRS